MPWVQYVGKRSLAGDVLGPNLVSNGHFTDGTTGWTGSNATLSKTADGKLRVTATSSSAAAIAQGSVTLESGALYRVDFDFTRGTGPAGLVYAASGSVLQTGVSGLADGSHGFYFVATATNGQISLYSNTGASTIGLYNDYDNVKVRKVIARGHATDIEHVTNPAFTNDAQWTKGTGWTIGSGVASSDGTQTTVSNLTLIDTSYAAVQRGKTYSTSFQITAYTAGTLGIALGSGSGVATGTSRSSAATFSESLTVPTNATTGLVRMQANADFVGSVDDVSVKLAADNTWSLDFDISSFQPGRDPNVEQVQMMDRSTDTQYYASKNLISVTTDILAYGEWQFMEEFIDNAIDGQTVIFDPYGTESQPKAPGSYILLPGAGLTRIVGADTTERRQYQLQFRQA